MSPFNIAVIVGSLRRDSFNAKLAKAIAKLAPAEFTLKYSQIGDLPLYNQDDDASQAPPVERLKAEIAAAQGLLFVTPEYNRSVPGVLKNAIDHASRPYGQSAFSGKPAGVIGVSVGAVGTAVAQQHLRNILPISTSLPWASPRHLFRPRKASSSPMAVSAPQVDNFCRAGSTDT